MNLHRLAVARARRLLEADVISRAELTERERTAEIEVEVRASKRPVDGNGDERERHSAPVEQRRINSVIPVTATLSGTVIERKISIGQIVEPADDLFTIADLSEVWVVAEAGAASVSGRNRWRPRCRYRRCPGRKSPAR